MVLSRADRRAKLQQFVQRGAADRAVGQHKLYYKNESRYYPVYKIDLDWMIYNKHNGRLETDMVTWQTEHAVADDEYDEELHSLIEEFLWKSNTQRNKYTLNDLKIKGQQRPAIITLDGVIIDGNRRAMLLRMLERSTNEKKYLEAVVLPDEYNDNEAEIVRLETQYQLGEDAKLEYGPLEKYLHVKRLHYNLGIDLAEVATLMGETEAQVGKYWQIMQLMDEYLDHIECPGLYRMLKYNDGSTMEGMFVDLQQDLKRFQGGSAAVGWPYEEMDLVELRSIQFDHIRYGGDLSGTGKDYRAISHDGGGKKSFFAHQDIWNEFRDRHQANVDPVTESMGTLDQYCARYPDFSSRIDAARARDEEWKSQVQSAIKENFGRCDENLEARVQVLEPAERLWRALNQLQRIDLDDDAFLLDSENERLVREINRISYEMKRRFERANR